jgi:hypothetical protein
VRWLPLSAVLVVVLAGCGSPPSKYALDESRACLSKTGAEIVRPTGDFVASTASEGTFRAVLHGGTNFVTLSFGVDDDEATQIAEGYDRFHGKNIGVSDILYQDHNVIMLWKLHPSDAELGVVTDCLK